MIILNAWYIFLGAAALIGNLGKANAFSFSLEPKVIQPGQRATLTLRLPDAELMHSGFEEDEVPEAQDSWLVKTERLELLDQDYRKAGGEYIWTYQFTSYSLGDVPIAPIAVQLGPQTFSSERLVLTVQTARAQDDQTLRPDMDEVPVPWNWKKWIFLLSLLVIGGVIVWYLRKFSRLVVRPAGRIVLHPESPREDPRAWLRKQLLVLRARLEITSEEFSPPDRWSGILREFAMRQTTLPVPAWTSGEIQVRLGNDGKWLAISKLMRDCDGIKFAPHPKSAQRDGWKQQTLHWIEESERLFL